MTAAVIDASIFISALVGLDQDSKWAESEISDIPLSCPELALAEATNILRRMEASGRISSLDAAKAHAELLQLDVELYPFTPFAERIWELRGNLTSYDAWYVALAETLDLPLVTLDLRLSRASGPRCEFIVPTSGSRS